MHALSIKLDEAPLPISSFDHSARPTFYYDVRPTPRDSLYPFLIYKNRDFDEKHPPTISLIRFSNIDILYGSITHSLLVKDEEQGWVCLAACFGSVATTDSHCSYNVCCLAHQSWKQRRLQNQAAEQDQ